MAVLEAFVQYRKPLEFDDVFDVHVTIAALGRVTFQMAYLLTVGDVAHVTGVTVHGCITSDGKATRMPEVAHRVRRHHPDHLVKFRRPDDAETS